MENMDSTVIATSLAAIAHDIGSDPIALKLALTAYLVALAIFIPISGWMSRRETRRSNANGGAENCRMAMFRSTIGERDTRQQAVCTAGRGGDRDGKEISRGRAKSQDRSVEPIK